MVDHAKLPNVVIVAVICHWYHLTLEKNENEPFDHWKEDTD